MPKKPNLKPINRAEHKFCIKSLHESLSGANKQNFMINLIKNGIPMATFYRWSNINFSSPEDIPTQKLDIIAALLGVKPSFLKNYTTKIGNNGAILQERK